MYLAKNHFYIGCTETTLQKKTLILVTIIGQCNPKLIYKVATYKS